MARNNASVCDCGRPTNRAVCFDCTNTVRRNLATIHDTVVPGPTKLRTRTVKDDNGTERTQTYVQPLGPDRLIPGLATDLDTAITRDTRFTTPAGGRHTRGNEEPLPLNLTASDARQDLTITLARAAAFTADARCEPHPVYTLYALAEYLDDKLDWIATQDAGRDCFDAINGAIRKATRVIDRPADRAYAGPCDVDGCDGELYAWDGSTLAKCTVCRTAVTLDDRRGDLLDQAHDLLLSATDIARLLRGLGEPVDARHIRVWASRGRLENRGPVADPRYRVGDVLVLVAQANTRRKATA
ncbi:hypothetical protein JN535_08550 [Cellulosimicrobium cellulans]|uniref:hypothetical protein n=1 Tax=Cellulosimicrobium cellulans TaxID=1710 RepID=UPI001963FC43|nr:hypothetical protein [Cellulosimicrobium cellulans]MBN0040215.1 hypothetical protein [Cellulosimicrobium cellulans]